MKLKTLAKKLDLQYSDSLREFELYNQIRENQIKKFGKLYLGQFQSPTISPSTIMQRSKKQKYIEHSVYQRSDYTPVKLEGKFNSYYKRIGNTKSQSLAFNSGMGAIGVLCYFLFNFKKVKKCVVGENVYFETNFMMEHYGKSKRFNEYKLNLSDDYELYWIEYPINCTKPSLYPFDEQLNLKKFFNVFLNMVRNKGKQFYLVIDYTLFYIPFRIEDFIKELPDNLIIFLITSLQKHRGYGFDLTNGGMITFYSKNSAADYLELAKIRAITGTGITQEAVWLMPKINNKVINFIIKESGFEAKRIFKLCQDVKPKVILYFADNANFLTSFIFVEIGKSTMRKSTKKPYFSDLLVKEIINAARKNNAYMLNGTSFGFPFTRIFKNSERYENTNSLRIAVGYDKNFNENIAEAISDGIKSFVKKYDP